MCKDIQEAVIMSEHIARWTYLSQVIVQRATLVSILSLAIAGSIWSLAATVGFAPWLRLDVGLGSVPIDAGVAVQLALSLLLLGLCFFIPMNDRVMRLENSHRTFRVTMWDVAQAYQTAHAADRDGCFSLKSEFDSVRERLELLRRHPDLGKLQPEILEMAAQMSHESRELAESYSTDRVERARQFLQQRQEEADQMTERVRAASMTCRELKGWLERVEIEEARARSELARFKEELEPLLYALDLRPAETPSSNVEDFSQRTFAAE
jgi:cell division septum initiation protein DivIVA